MLRMNLLIGKTTTNKHSDIFLRIIHTIYKIKLKLRYFSYIYISYQMYITWSCVAFYHLLNTFPQANDSRINTFWKWFRIRSLYKVYTASFWTEPFSMFQIFMKNPCKTKRFAKVVLTNKENPEYTYKYFKALWAVLGHSRPKFFSGISLPPPNYFLSYCDPVHIVYIFI